VIKFDLNRCVYSQPTLVMLESEGKFIRKELSAAFDRLLQTTILLCKLYSFSWSRQKIVSQEILRTIEDEGDRVGW
jgi:hypothetical protein